MSFPYLKSCGPACTVLKEKCVRQSLFAILLSKLYPGYTNAKKNSIRVALTINQLTMSYDVMPAEHDHE